MQEKCAQLLQARYSTTLSDTLAFSNPRMIPSRGVGAIVRGVTLPRQRFCLAACLAPLHLFLCCCGNSGASDTTSRRAVMFPNPPEDDSRRPPDRVSPSDGEIALGTSIGVEISDVIDSDTAVSGLFVHGRVVADVRGRDGKIVIPARSSGVVAVLAAVKNNGTSSVSLALYQLTIGEQSYLLNRGTKQLARLEFTEEAASGLGHRSVHLESHSVLTFMVSEKIVFKR